jgi:hypothetical protein
LADQLRLNLGRSWQSEISALLCYSQLEKPNPRLATRLDWFKKRLTESHPIQEQVAKRGLLFLGFSS